MLYNVHVKNKRATAQRLKMNINEKVKNEIDKHKKWLNKESGGKIANLRLADLVGANLSEIDLRWAYLSRANLREADLSGANLSGADLVGANLSEADLRWADLSRANLREADLSGADLRGADLRGANLRLADLSRADLSGANLRGADLNGANISDISYNENTSFYAMVCPEKGSFIGYKKASGKIVELMITENAKRSSSTTRKCRCSAAVVLSITNIDGTNFDGEKVVSDYDEEFVYEVGKTVSVDNFDENRWEGCSTGIHFFLTRDEAVRH